MKTGALKSQGLSMTSRIFEDRSERRAEFGKVLQHSSRERVVGSIRRLLLQQTKCDIWIKVNKLQDTGCRMSYLDLVCCSKQ